MRVTYIEHSGFMVELERTVLIFDYYKGVVPEYNRSKKAYIFASHRHEDHFNPYILNWQGDVEWILSDDIQIESANKIHYVEANCRYVMDELICETLTSTDEGVAFMVQVEGLSIYHGGDLNWWHWEGENSEIENKDAKEAFLNEMLKLSGRSFDLAFVPLDPRQNAQFSWGMLTFFKRVMVKLVFPMHMWGDYAVIDRFLSLDEAIEYRDKIVRIKHANQIFEVVKGEHNELYVESF